MEKQAGQCDANDACFEHLHVLRHLGRGAFGEVFLVTPGCAGKGHDDHVGGQVFALKRSLLAQLSENARKQALGEAAFCKELGQKHQHILRCFAFRFNSDGVAPSLELLLEYAPLGDLNHRIHIHKEYCDRQCSGLPQPEIVAYCVNIADALAYLHSLTPKVLHRDVKPANILLFPAQGCMIPHAKLADFGIAKALESDSSLSGTIIGTPHYFSPEMCRGQAYDERADAWALGVVTYEMLFLQRPFHAVEKDLPILALRICEGRYDKKALRSLDGEYSSLLLDVMEGLLAVELKRRLRANDVVQCLCSLKSEDIDNSVCNAIAWWQNRVRVSSRAEAQPSFDHSGVTDTWEGAELLNTDGTWNLSTRESMSPGTTEEKRTTRPASGKNMEDTPIVPERSKKESMTMQTIARHKCNQGEGAANISVSLDPRFAALQHMEDMLVTSKEAEEDQKQVANSNEMQRFAAEKDVEEKPAAARVANPDLDPRFASLKHLEEMLADRVDDERVPAQRKPKDDKNTAIVEDAREMDEEEAAKVVVEARETMGAAFVPADAADDSAPPAAVNTVAPLAAVAALATPADAVGGMSCSDAVDAVAVMGLWTPAAAVAAPVEPVEAAPAKGQREKECLASQGAIAAEVAVAEDAAKEAKKKPSLATKIEKAASVEKGESEERASRAEEQLRTDGAAKRAAAAECKRLDAEVAREPAKHASEEETERMAAEADRAMAKRADDEECMRLAAEADEVAARRAAEEEHRRSVAEAAEAKARHAVEEERRRLVAEEEHGRLAVEEEHRRLVAEAAEAAARRASEEECRRLDAQAAEERAKRAAEEERRRFAAEVAEAAAKVAAKEEEARRIMDADAANRTEEDALVKEDEVKYMTSDREAEEEEAEVRKASRTRYPARKKETDANCVRMASHAVRVGEAPSAESLSQASSPVSSLNVPEVSGPSDLTLCAVASDAVQDMRPSTQHAEQLGAYRFIRPLWGSHWPSDKAPSLPVVVMCRSEMSLSRFYPEGESQSDWVRVDFPDIVDELEATMSRSASRRENGDSTLVDASEAPDADEMPTTVCCQRRKWLSLRFLYASIARRTSPSRTNDLITAF